MPTEAKRETVAELREELAKARTMIVSEYRGLKVKEIAEIRRALRKQDVTYRVVKNRLMRIAAEDSVGEALSPLLNGPTAIAFGTDEAGTAKAVLDATRPYARVVRITGGVLGDKAIGAEDVTRLAALPPREVLLAKLAGGMQAPVGTLAGLFAAPLRNLGYALQQVAEQKAQAEPVDHRPDDHSDRPPRRRFPDGSPDPGRSARSDRQDDRARAVRVHQALRGALRRDRRRAGCRRGRPGRRWRCRRSRRRSRGADRVHRDPDRDRARTRSRSSRSSAS